MESLLRNTSTQASVRRTTVAYNGVNPSRRTISTNPLHLLGRPSDESFHLRAGTAPARFCVAVWLVRPTALVYRTALRMAAASMSPQPVAASNRLTQHNTVPSQFLSSVARSVSLLMGLMQHVTAASTFGAAHNGATGGSSKSLLRKAGMTRAFP